MDAEVHTLLMCRISQVLKGLLMIHHQSRQLTDPRIERAVMALFECEVRSSEVWLMHSFGCDWLICSGNDSGGRATQSLDCATKRTTTRVLTNNHLLLEHHCRIHREALNAESWIVRGRTHTDVVRLQVGVLRDRRGKLSGGMANNLRTRL